MLLWLLALVLGLPVPLALLEEPVLAPTLSVPPLLPGSALLPLLLSFRDRLGQLYFCTESRCVRD